jgi:hypothetical protein
MHPISPFALMALHTLGLGFTVASPSIFGWA